MLAGGMRSSAPRKSVDLFDPAIAAKDTARASTGRYVGLGGAALLLLARTFMLMRCRRRRTTGPERVASLTGLTAGALLTRGE
jgi:hypothetical protein